MDAVIAVGCSMIIIFGGLLLWVLRDQRKKKAHK